MAYWKIAAGFVGMGLLGAGGVLYVGFGAFLPWRERAEANRVADLAGVGAGQTVAEVGAGPARFTEILAARVGAGGRVFASELGGAPYETLAARVKPLANVTAVRAERTTTTLPDGCCDVVLMRNVYHHISDPVPFIREVGRLVRPGGRIVVIDFAPGDLWFHGGRPADAAVRRPGHGVSTEAAIAEFRAAGFEAETIRPRWVWPMWMVIFKRV